MNLNPHDIKLVAADMDGTFACSDYTYDVARFKAALSRMKAAGCQFVIASGNQYYQLALRGTLRRFLRTVSDHGSPSYDACDRYPADRRLRFNESLADDLFVEYRARCFRACGDLCTSGR